MKVQLIATKPMRYATRALKAGDLFFASPRHARILKLIKKAEDTPSSAGASPSSSTGASAKPRRPRGAA